MRTATIWLTGLSGAGKSTIANALAQELRLRGKSVEVLDGDVVRTNLSRGLGFSKEDRDTNILRIGFVCHLLTRNGAFAIGAAISPYREIREQVRRQIGDFVEVYVHCPLEVLLRRDVKGLYAKALRGEIPNFTGVSDPYEAPERPEVVVHTDQETLEESVGKVLAKLEELGYLERGSSASGTRTVAGSHGGALVQRELGADAARALLERASELQSVTLSPRQLSDARLIANGAFSPLQGFLQQEDYRAVVEQMRLADGRLWPLPVTLAVSDNAASALPPQGEVALRDTDGHVVGLMELAEKYGYEKEREAQLVYRTTDKAHPGVANLYSQGDVLLGGSIAMLPSNGSTDGAVGRYPSSPAQVREEIARRGWRTMVGFQTRNPVHRAHEYIQKCAMEMVDGLLLHPLVGETKSDDIPAEVRMRCYEALLGAYYPAQRALLAVFPAFMRYAGPREAVFHALVRKNYGCTHFIVGRDHAGVGRYYGPYDAHALLSSIPPADLGVTPVFYENAFYCRRCGAMATEKTCPHPEESRFSLSGTQVREILARGGILPAELTRPEVSKVLSVAGAK
ncbi:MAG: sulfate adenylyltransferase [Chloroflexi bacterium]|nr:sulfate adenylyltransferase [Chloroflexota bacterium]